MTSGLFFLVGSCCLFFSIVFFSCFFLSWEIFPLVNLFKLLVLVFLFFFSLRNFSFAHFIIAHDFFLLVFISSLGDFSLQVSISQVFTAHRFCSSIFHHFKKVFIRVVRLLSVLRLAKFAFKMKSNCNNVLC